MAMKVLYDYQAFKMQKFGGISRYFYNLCKYNNGFCDYKVQANFLDNVYLDEISENKKCKIKRPFPGKGIFINGYNKIDLSMILLNSDFDIFHPTYYSLSKIHIFNPIVLTVHDFINELFPYYWSDSFNTINNKKNAIYKADRIIAVSQSTKNDLLKFYPEIPEDKIDVVYHAIEWTPNEQHILSRKINNPYILFTGQRWFYKNFKLFAKAISPLLKKYDLYLICTGSDFTQQEKQYIEDLNIADRTFVIFADENELKALYEHALCFVFPSLYEGFGLPILEAFASNCPIAISNASCFPEIADDSALYFDPNSESEICKTVENLITSESLRNELVQKGSDRFNFFSMDSFIKNTYNFYEKTLETKR